MFGKNPQTEKHRKRHFELIQSQSQNPLFNLSLEESLFDNYDATKEKEVFLFYTNSKSIFIGKHQNPWKECNIELIFKNNIPFLRRSSGGGAVYHDLGNINWCFISPRQNFSQEENLFIIKDLIIRSTGINDQYFFLTPRGDILCDGFKISGNALMFKKDKVLHHGTILMNSNLDALNQYLKGLGYFYSIQFNCSGVKSVYHPVGNLSSLEAYLGVDRKHKKGLAKMLVDNEEQARWNRIHFLNAIEAVFTEMGFGLIPRDQPPPPLMKLLKRNVSSEWQFSRTPNFEIVHENGFTVRVQQGIAISDEGSTWNLANTSDLLEFQKCLKI